MDAQGIYSDYAFTRNPIILKGTGAMASVSNVATGSFLVEYEELRIFEGRFSSPLKINIAEIVDAYVPFFSEPSPDNDTPIVLIENASSFAHRELRCTFELGTNRDEFACYVIPGGISGQNFKQHIQAKTDIFKTRFLNPNENIFLTTRTNARLITLKETELYPLYFLLQASGTTIAVEECITGCVYEANDLGNMGVAVLDIAALRRYFAEHENVLASVFNVYCNSKLTCRIVVESCPTVKERYRLKFRNSLGVFEIIELVGQLSFTPDYSDSEEKTFNRYDEDVARFYADRDRVARKQTITIESVVKHPAELSFLMDMLGSEEVWLLDADSVPVKVLPSIEEFSYALKPKTPHAFNIKLEISTNEVNIMHNIDIKATKRLFSKQFSKQFN